MNPELEALLKAWDAFTESPEGAEGLRLRELYDARLAETAERLGASRETVHRIVLRAHPRWVRANLPPGFPTTLGLD